MTGTIHIVMAMKPLDEGGASRFFKQVSELSDSEV